MTNMIDINPSPLTKVASIQILSGDYDLSRNGSDFHLVEHKEPDAYLRPVARKIDLIGWLDSDNGHKRVQELLNILGARYQEIECLKSELERVNIALQREAEPSSHKSRRQNKDNRENLLGVNNILEPVASEQSEG